MTMVFFPHIFNMARPAKRSRVIRMSRAKKSTSNSGSSFVPVNDKDLQVAYVKGGSRIQKQRFVMKWLNDWLRFQKNLGKDGAIVFDIDDTLVDGEDDDIKHSSVVKVYRSCQKLGFKCCIITARPEVDGNRSETIRMLHSHGINDWESLYMMPPNTKHTTEHISTYKFLARQDLRNRYHIIANVGDMWHDLVRMPFSGAHKKLGNPTVQDCAVLFPKRSYADVAVKLSGRE